MRQFHQIEQGSPVVEIYAGVKAFFPVSRQGRSPIPPFVPPLGKRFSERVADQRIDRGMGSGCELLDLGKKIIREIDGCSHASKHIEATY